MWELGFDSVARRGPSSTEPTCSRNSREMERRAHGNTALRIHGIQAKSTNDTNEHLRAEDVPGAAN